MPHCDLVETRNTLFRRALAAVMLLASSQAHADSNDLLAGLFDAAVGAPFATKMLDIVRSGESTSTSPAALDRRLTAVEQLLTNVNDRLSKLEIRVNQLQIEVVRTEDISRLREYQRLTGEIGLVNTELKTHPTDRGRLVFLEAKARELADSIRKTPSFDLWMWTDIDEQGIRTRFHDAPTFHIYTLALAAWLSTLTALYDERPVALTVEVGPAVKKHVEFLRVRSGWRDQVQAPATLPEYVNTAVFCRPVSAAISADRNGNCSWATECVDNIDGKKTPGDGLLLHMSDRNALCTADINTQWDFPKEQELRFGHGEELMAVLADALEKIAVTGSLADQYVGVFADWILTPIYSVSLKQPLQAPIGSRPGAVPVIAGCLNVTGCRLPATNEAAWQVAPSAQAHYVRNEGASLCLDVERNAIRLGAGLIMWTCNGTPSQKWEKRSIDQEHYQLASAGSNFCVTVSEDPPQSGPIEVRVLRPERSLSLQACSSNPRQMFYGGDSSAGPN